MFRVIGNFCNVSSRVHEKNKDSCSYTDARGELEDNKVSVDFFVLFCFVEITVELDDDVVMYGVQSDVAVAVAVVG